MLALGAGLALTPSAHAQLVMGNDQSPATLWLVDVSGVRPPRALLTGPQAVATALAADDGAGQLYWVSAGVLYRAAYSQNTLVPVAIGTITGASSQVTGLAYDAADHVLIGRAGAGLYELSLATAAATLRYAITAQDFGGLDYDSATDTFYGANDTTATSVLVGRGVYRITKPLSSPTFTRIALYPGTDTDLDGLAVGGGMVYLVKDSPGPIAVLNLASGSYAPSLTSPFTGSGTNAGATWAPGLMPQTAAANLAAAVTAPASCQTSPGQLMPFVVTMSNAGPNAAQQATLTITLPPNAAFAGSTPTLTPTGNHLTLTTPSLAPGGQASVTVRLVAPASGDVVVGAAAASSTDDPTPANNSAVASARVRPVPPPGGAHALYTTLNTLATSRVPGEPSLRFTSFGPPAKSPSGARILWRADTTAGGVVVRLGGAGAATLAREGVYPVLPSWSGPEFPPLHIDPAVAINDSDAWAMSGEDARGAPGADGFVARFDGAWTRIAHESFALPGTGPNIRFGDRRGSLSIQDDGSVSFVTSLQGFLVSANDDEAAVTGDGWSILARKGMTAPFGQGGGASDTLGAIDFGAAPGAGFWVAPLGLRWAMTGTLNAAPASDRVGLVDLGVVAQEGSPAPSGPGGCVGASPQPAAMRIESDGSWWCVGACADGRAWVTREWAPLALSGDPISPGASEHWASGPGAFTLALGNRTGGVVIGGRTDAPGLAAGAIVDQDGVVRLRLNDPVDADANGSFDDALYVRDIVPFSGVLTDNGDLLVLVTLRDEAAALCGGPDISVGQALIWLPGPAAPGCEPDVNQDGNADQDDVAYLINVIGGAPNGTGFDPDFNHDGNADQDDVAALIGVIAGEPCP